MIQILHRRPLKRGERLPEDGCLVELDARLTLAGITCERQNDDSLGVGGPKRWLQGDERPVHVWFDDDEGSWIANGHPVETYSEIASLISE